MKVSKVKNAGLLAGIVILVVVLFGISMVINSSGETKKYKGLPVGSTYSADPSGCELMYRMFEDLGFKVEQHRRPLLKEILDSEAIDVIWHTSGKGDVGNDEIEWLDSWVDEGGTLVLVDNPDKGLTGSVDPLGTGNEDQLITHWYDRLLLVDGLREVLSIADRSNLNISDKRMPVGITRKWPVKEINEIYTYKRQGIGEPYVFRLIMQGDKTKDVQAKIKDGYGAVLVWSGYGQGQVWIVSDPYIFSNMLIQESDNAKLAACLPLESRGGEFSTILFDEYHLGFVQSITVMDAMRTPLGKGILFMGLVVALAIGTAGARFGPVRKSDTTIGVSQRAYVKALAGMWQGANAVTTAAGSLYRRYSSKMAVRRKSLDVELDRIRNGKGRIEELIDIAQKLDN